VVANVSSSIVLLFVSVTVTMIRRLVVARWFDNVGPVAAVIVAPAYKRGSRRSSVAFATPLVGTIAFLGSSALAPKLFAALDSQPSFAIHDCDKRRSIESNCLNRIESN